MAQFSKVVQQDGSWRLRDERTGEYVGRIWATAHIDRILRDGTFAETVAATLAGPGTRAEKRAAVVDAYQSWLAGGGQALDLNLLGQVIRDGNVWLVWNGTLEVGYVHGEVYNRGRLFRFFRLAERVHAARQLLTAAERNAATDAAVDDFVAEGGVD